MTSREDGQAILLIVIMCLMLMLLSALVYDGGRIITAQQDAAATAAEAARAGSSALAGTTRAGTPTIDGAAAVRAAQDYLAADAGGYQGTVTVTGATVSVTVSRHLDLGGFGTLLGEGSPTVTATGSSQPLHGVRNQQ